MLKELVFRITSLSVRHQQRISSESWNSMVFWQVCLCLDWQRMPANPYLKCNKEKQSLSEWVGAMSTESHMWRGRERERDEQRERALLSLHDSVPETYFLLLSPQWVILTWYVLCCRTTPPPIPPCDWWASFCQLMANPLLTIIRLPFISVGVSVMDSF